MAGVAIIGFGGVSSNLEKGKTVLQFYCVFGNGKIEVGGLFAVGEPLHGLGAVIEVTESQIP